MADTPLATPNDALRFGYGDVSTENLAKASARVRGYTRQRISLTTATITGRGSLIKLPGRPVREVTSVKDAWDNELPYVLQPGGILRTANPRPLQTSFSNIWDYVPNDVLTIEYTFGWPVIPDHIVEIVCAIASRLEQLSPGLRGGVQQESGGSEAQTFGWDSHQGVGDLVKSEKDRLDRAFPRRIGSIVARA
jgi:hypothetical protein